MQRIGGASAVFEGFKRQSGDAQDEADEWAREKQATGLEREMNQSSDIKIYDNLKDVGFLFAFILIMLVVLVCMGGARNLVPFFPLAFLLLLYCRIRLDSEAGTLYICGVIPVLRIAWKEVVQYVVFPECVFFKNASGAWRRLLFTSFGEAERLGITAFLREKCPQAKTALPTPDEWLKVKIHKRWGIWFYFAALALILGGLGTSHLVEALRWDSRVRKWIQVPGGILKNEPGELPSRKSKKTISRIEYEYHFQEQRYTGNRILYDDKYFPSSRKPGTKCMILVNPANPADSAAMVEYRGHWGLVRYAWPAICFAMLLLVLCYSVSSSLVRKRCFIPDRLRAYASVHPASMPPLSFPPSPIEGLPVNRLPATCDGGTWHARDSWLPLVAVILLLVGFPLSGAIFLPFPPGYVATFLGLAIVGACMPKSILLDIREKRLILSGILRRQKEISLVDVNWLCLRVRVSQICLDAVRQNGTRVRLFRVPERFLQQMLDLLPELGEQMGNIPIAFDLR